METVRGTCVAIGGHGVLLRGPSGCGKSDLALRLIEDGAELVADDYTDIDRRDASVIATAPPAISGLLEVRGLGVLRVHARAAASLAAVVELVEPDNVERMCQPERVNLAEAALPLFRLAAFEASAATKVRLAVRIATGAMMVVQ